MFQTDFGDIMCSGTLNVHDKLDGGQDDLIDVCKQGLGLVDRNDHGLWLSCEIAKGISIRLSCQSTGTAIQNPNGLTDFRALIRER